jgi:hypothetical protein
MRASLRRGKSPCSKGEGRRRERMSSMRSHSCGHHVSACALRL